MKESKKRRLSQVISDLDRNKSPKVVRLSIDPVLLKEYKDCINEDGSYSLGGYTIYII